MLTKKKSSSNSLHPTSYVQLEFIYKLLQKEGYLNKNNALIRKDTKKGKKRPLDTKIDERGIITSIFKAKMLEEILALAKEKQAEGWVAVSKITFCENDGPLHSGKLLFNMKKPLEPTKEKKAYNPFLEYRIKMVYLKGISPTIAEELNKTYEIG